MEQPPNNERAGGLEIEVLQVLDAASWKYGLQIAFEIGARRMERGSRPNLSYSIARHFRSDKEPRIEDYIPRNTIYTVLTRMVARGLLEFRLETPEEQAVRGPLRRLYRLAPGGERAKLSLLATRSRQGDWEGEPEPA